LASPLRSQALGAAAEKAAVRFLKSQGYTIIARNVSTRLGEIDIIAAEGDILCFVEVKSRSGSDFAPPSASVGSTKQRRIRAAAQTYLVAKGLQNRLCRFDVVSMVPVEGQTRRWEIELLRDAF
jgi:putative endonuclease